MSRAQMAKFALVVAIALAGVLVGRASISSADRQVESQPSRTPTERAAVTAAIEYLAALRWDVLVDEEERRRVIAARATTSAAASLNEALAPAAEALREAVRRPPVVARTAVLGYRVLRADARRADVRLWGMAVFGTRAYRPTSQWSTSDVSLVWSRDRWLVEAIESRGGPSPTAGLGELVRRTRDLKDVRHVP